MILTELKAYLDHHGTSKRLVIAHHFGLSEDGVDAMFQVWINKGKVIRIQDTHNGVETGVRYAINRGISLNVRL